VLSTSAMTEPLAARDALRLKLLVLRCQAGDEAAFAALYREFAPRTLAYARGIVGDDAEDVQQETWLAVYRGLKTLHDPGAFVVWVLRTTRHRAFNHLRRYRRERELADDIPLESIPAEEADTQPPAFDTIDAAAIDVAMAEMPPPQREVLLLRFRDDLSYAQIAQVTGVPIGTIRARLHYAKKRLHVLLTLSGEST
jgi:RNA polymerase sigma-70 factor (ECF subfamily)